MEDTVFTWNYLYNENLHNFDFKNKKKTNKMIIKNYIKKKKVLQAEDGIHDEEYWMLGKTGGMVRVQGGI